MMKLLPFILLFMIPALWGCASLHRDTTQIVSVSTRPQGATVTAKAGLSCITPCTLPLDSWSDHLLIIAKQGYEPLRISVKSVFREDTAPIGGCAQCTVPRGGDFLEYELVPETVEETLQPVSASP
jgi:hypothetical protein